jgi:uncharacterized protein (TIGR01777 family)
LISKIYEYEVIFINALIFGGTGFIGRNLIKELQDYDYKIYLVVRNPNKLSPKLNSIEKIIEWNYFGSLSFLSNLKKIDVLINLTGESINKRRWTNTIKEEILYSRLNSTKEIVSAINNNVLQPDIFINSSATGYYGSCRDQKLTESDVAGQDFLAKVCLAWENEANKIKNADIRVITLRTGIVLGSEGALSQMVIPFRFFIGGPLGSGNQWCSWIHIKDLTSMIRYIIEHPNLNGAINATAPEPIRMKNFCNILGKSLNRPSWLPIPEAILKLALGEMSSILTNSNRVIPNKILQTDFEYKFINLTSALSNLL